MSARDGEEGAATKSAMVLFNEIEPYPAQWLRNLYPAATVLEADIRTLTGADLAGYTRCHFFAGIGGWEYALWLAGWPATAPVWTGSCPCQPFSAAGKRRGESDERHLWPEFYRLIAECRPPVVFGEQVASAAGRDWLTRVRADLEVLGYAVGAADLAAAGVAAPHIRQRLYWVADAGSERRQQVASWPSGHEAKDGRESNRSHIAGGGSSARGMAITPSGAGSRVDRILATNPSRESEQGAEPAYRGADGGLEQPDSERCQTGRLADATRAQPIWGSYDLIPCLDGKTRRVEPGSFPLAHGVPQRVGRLRAYGNAIVPPLAAEFVMAFMEASSWRRAVLRAKNEPREYW